MRFNTDLPYGRKAVRQYIETRGESRLAPNVSAEADAAFIIELERTDPSHHARLMKAQGTRKFESDRWAVGNCSGCSGQILDASFVRDGVEFCSRTCRDGSNPDKRDRSKPRHYRTCAYPGCARKFLARRANNTTCSNRCRQKTYRGKAVTDSRQAPSGTLINPGEK